MSLQPLFVVYIKIKIPLLYYNYTLDFNVPL